MILAAPRIVTFSPGKWPKFLPFRGHPDRDFDEYKARRSMSPDMGAR
jgi:hypothetical protein